MPDPERGNPLKTARYYQARKRAGTWEPRAMESLLMLMDTREQMEELADLVRKVDAGKTI